MWSIKVWWSDGRVTQTLAETRSRALDVVSGECHPYERYTLTDPYGESEKVESL